MSEAQTRLSLGLVTETYSGSVDTVPGPCHCTIFGLFYLNALVEITLTQFCFPEILEIKLEGLHALAKCSELHTQPLKCTEF